jgi:two-component system sensor histidine kinase UhpB
LDRAIIHRDGTGFAHHIVGSIQDMSQVYRLNEELAEASRQAYRRSQRLNFEAEERERNRIAEELHDRVNPLLAAAKLQIGISESSADNAQEYLTQSKFLIVEAVDAIRNLSHRISLVLLKDRSLDEILESFLRRLNTGELPVVKVTGKKLEGIPDVFFKLNVLRIVQARFLNTVKSGQARKFDVELYTRQGLLHLQILDDGSGFDLKTDSGVGGIPEIASRVEAYGGKMKVSTAPGKGCRLDIQMPLEIL